MIGIIASFQLRAFHLSNVYSRSQNHQPCLTKENNKWTYAHVYIQEKPIIAIPMIPISPSYQSSNLSHVVLGSFSSSRHAPVDVLVGHLDVAGLAMDAATEDVSNQSTVPNRNLQLTSVH